MKCQKNLSDVDNLEWPVTTIEPWFSPLAHIGSFGRNRSFAAGRCWSAKRQPQTFLKGYSGPARINLIRPRYFRPDLGSFAKHGLKKGGVLLNRHGNKSL